jgi:hypothetical protein
VRENAPAFCPQEDHGRAVISCGLLIHVMITREKTIAAAQRLDICPVAKLSD